MDTSRWAQAPSTTSSPITTTRPAPPPQSQQPLVERRTRPLEEQALNCPRCNSTNTKFCYYNNYSLTQPRYFCKTCRRYWTEGGSLRNVPVGGGSRKNKKHTSSNSNSSSSSSKINLQPSSGPIINASPYSGQGQDLNLGFPLNNNLSHLIGGNFPNIESTAISGGLSALELLRSTTSAMYGGGGFGLHEFSSSANSVKYNPLNGIGDHGMQLFPFGDLKQVNVKSTDENEPNKGQSGDPGAIFWINGANLGSGGGAW